MLGGVGIEVEVDEAKFGKRKFHRGIHVDGVWVFGIVERGSCMTKCCLVAVDRRDEETLIREIRKKVRPGTTIYSDCWKSYARLSEWYEDKTVSHSLNFKDPITGACTNTIEGLWNQVRRWMPRFGTTKKHYALYFLELMYRRRYFFMISRKERLSVFLTHLSELGFMWACE